MSDTLNYVVLRGPQRIVPAAFSTMPLVVNPPVGIDDVAVETLGQDAVQLVWMYRVEKRGEAYEAAQKFCKSAAAVGSPVPLASPIRRLDVWLASKQNRPERDELVYFLFELAHDWLDIQPGADPVAALRAEPRWWLDRKRVEASLAASVFRSAVPQEYRADLTRLMLVFGLVDLLPENPSPINSADSIFAALRWRTVLLWKSLLDLLRRPNYLVRRPGFSDYYILRQEWFRYEPGEIAHIENVLRGEAKKRTHTRREEREETQITETERAEASVLDTQTTDRFQLSESAREDMNLQIQLEGSVNTSGMYGPTKVDTHIGGSLDFSLSTSREHAFSVSRESVSRAVQKTEQRVRSVRAVRTLTRVTETNAHSIDNTKGENSIAGIYRWVDRIDLVQLFRYPHRYLLEFEIPEPAAWWRWLAQRQDVTKAPDPFTVNGKPDGKALTADDLETDPANPMTYYLNVAARYQATGIDPPPQNRTVAKSLLKESKDDPSVEAQPIRFGIESTVAVPDGWVAKSWRAAVLSWHQPRGGDLHGSIDVTVGEHIATTINPTQEDITHGDDRNGLLGGTVGNVNTGNVPIAIRTDAVRGYSINIIVDCQPSDEAMRRWQMDTYDRLVARYDELQRRYEEQLRAREIQAGISISEDSPARSREVVRDEIKRLVIEMLMAEDFTGRPALEFDPETKEPEVRLDEAERSAAEIQFLEQSFEWENLSYVLYAYYWAAKERRPDLAPIKGTDAEFARFLRSGSARVVVPARRGFESQVQFYVDFGVLRGGGPVPGPEDENYLSIADEIKSLQRGADDAEALESWTIRLPTTLVYLDGAATLPLEKPDPELEPPPE